MFIRVFMSAPAIPAFQKSWPGAARPGRPNEHATALYDHGFAIVKRQARPGRWLVSFPDLPEAGTDGRTLEEAAAEAVDCLGEALASRLADHEAIPTPSTPRRSQWVLAPEETLALKIALNQALAERGGTTADLARLLECDHREARRLPNPREPSKAPRLTQALAALGYGVELSVYDQSKRERVLSSPLARRATMLQLGKRVRARKFA